MKYILASVEVVRYPLLRVTFSDGFSGEYDLTDMIHHDTLFAPLINKGYFASVRVKEDGRSFGWNLDKIGHEIEFCADATRVMLETQAVMTLAQSYAARFVAAE